MSTWLGEIWNGEQWATGDSSFTYGDPLNLSLSCSKIKQYWSTATDIKEDNSVTPQYYTLSQNYPNPFNPTTIVSYQIVQQGKVELKVFNLLGKEVATLVNQSQSAGSYKVKFDTRLLPNGMYFYRLQSGDFAETKKSMLLK